MKILRNLADVTNLDDPSLRLLVERRIQQIEECCPWDSAELGPFIVVEPGDSAETLEAEIGFPVLRGIFDDVPFGDDEFSPSFEWAEIHPGGLFELVYIVSDSGAGYDIFIYDLPGVDINLLSMCNTYATPGNAPDSALDAGLSC